MDLTGLKAEIERNKQVDGSAKALITGLAQKLEEAKDNPVELQALIDSLKTDNDDLAAAVAANTPAAEPPTA